MSTSMAHHHLHHRHHRHHRPAISPSLPTSVGHATKHIDYRRKVKVAQEPQPANCILPTSSKAAVTTAAAEEREATSSTVKLPSRLRPLQVPTTKTTTAMTATTATTITATAAARSCQILLRLPRPLQDLNKNGFLEESPSQGSMQLWELQSDLGLPCETSLNPTPLKPKPLATQPEHPNTLNPKALKP